MTPEQIDRVFGRGRLKMVTGEHVEVYREAVAPGEPRRYTKRFLATPNGDFGPWTEREWRILARLIGHGIRCVPDVVHFDAGATSGMRSVQTCDAGVTVDQWATLVPVVRDGAVRRHMFEDCAHWWALAHYCLVALREIHALELVHLDIKADNICIPYAPALFDPDAAEDRLYPVFARLALIDFAFSLVSRESLALALPFGWQKDYDYQSPRLLKALDAGRDGDLEPTRELDWRCDFYSLAAMLKRYLPSDRRGVDGLETGWTSRRYDDARSLIFRLRDTHDRDLPRWRPHPELIDFCAARLDEPDLVGSLQQGWMLGRREIAAGAATPITPITPVTRIAIFRRVASVTPLTHIASPEPIVCRDFMAPRADGDEMAAIGPHVPRPKVKAGGRAKLVLLSLVAGVAASAPSFIGNAGGPLSSERASPTSVEGPAVSPMQPASSTSSADGAPAATPSGPEAANPAGDANDRTQRSQPEEVARIPEPAAGIGVSGALTNDESGPVSGNPREQATVADAAHAAVSTPGEKASSSSDATPREQAASSASQTRAKSSAPTKRPAMTSRSSAPWNTMSKPPHGREASLAHASARARAAPRAPTSAVAQSTSPVARVRVAMAKPSVKASSLTLPQTSSSPAVAGGRPPPIAQLDATLGSAGAGGSTGAPIDSHASAPADAAPSRVLESGAEERSPAAPAKPAPRPSGAKNALQALLGNVVGLLKARDHPPAPVEERDVLRSPVASPSPRPQHLASVASTPIAGPAAVQLALASETPGASPNLASTAPGLRSGAIALAAVNSPSAVLRAPASPPATAAVSQGFVEPSMPPGSAPGESFSGSPAGGPTPTVRATLPQTAAASAAVEVPARTHPDADPLTMHAKWMLADAVPRIAARAQRDITPVLRAAGEPPHPTQTETIAEFAHAKWTSEDESISASDVSPSYARLLHATARQALASGRGAALAADIELRAFGANPHDPEIAAYLAFLYLRADPVRPETARELALHAIVISGPRRSTRSGDWGVLAVASALSGRENDATRALLVEVALTNDLDATCRAALSAYSRFGEPLRTPVQAMLYRVHALPGAYAYPSCVWPSLWTSEVHRQTAF